MDWVEKLHEVVDELAAPVAEANAKRLRCRAGCSDCCTDGLTVFSIEAELIQRHHAALLHEGRPHPEGACAFLDAEGRCRIYAQRPYVCRTQGLPLRWLDEEGGEVFESRDICPKNIDGGPPLEELAASECWTLGPFEERLAAKQATGERVPLRSLFTFGRRHLPVL